MIEENTKNFISDSLAFLIENNVTDKFKALDPLVEKVTVKVDTLPIMSDGEHLFIPIGTKDVPRGLSKFYFEGGRFIYISNSDTFYVFHVDELKALIKGNQEVFVKGMGPDFETMGYTIKWNQFKELNDV